MTRTKLWLVLVLAVGVAASLEMLPTVTYRWAVIRAMATAKPHPDLYHRPQAEPCRSRYLLIPHAFSRGRETWDACWNGYAPPSIDFLLDDEDVALGVQVRTR